MGWGGYLGPVAWGGGKVVVGLGHTVLVLALGTVGRVWGSGVTYPGHGCGLG